MKLFGIIGLLAQASVETETLNETSGSLFSLLLHANGVVQLTLLLLIGFSIVSWAIIGSKYRQLARIKRSCAHFYELFWKVGSLHELQEKRSFRKSPAFRVFQTALNLSTEKKATTPESLKREVKRALEDEIEQMEYGVPFLATTGSAAPFIGLFGTVWGILTAFWKIGRTGASSLAIVGPHIAEALIATAIGLAAAIPAVIFYNIYVNRIRLLTKDLADFSDDVVHRFEQEHFHA